MGVLARVHARREPRRQGRSGFVGPGRIGRETARLAEAFGATAIYAGRGDPLPELLAGGRRRQHPLPADGRDAPSDRRRPRSPTCSRPRCSSTRPAARSSTRPRSSTRSAAGAIAGAALDVFEFEPAVTEELLSHGERRAQPAPRQRHAGTREAMGMLAVEALRAVLLEDRTSGQRGRLAAPGTVQSRRRCEPRKDRDDLPRRSRPLRPDDLQPLRAQRAEAARRLARPLAQLRRTTGRSRRRARSSAARSTWASPTSTSRTTTGRRTAPRRRPSGA